MKLKRLNIGTNVILENKWAINIILELLYETWDSFDSLRGYNSLEATNESCLYFIGNNLASSPNIILFEAYRRKENITWTQTWYRYLNPVGTQHYVYWVRYI